MQARLTARPPPRQRTPEHAVATLQAEWVGAGARLSGPRFAVRAALRWAMP